MPYSSLYEWGVIVRTILQKLRWQRLLLWLTPVWGFLILHVAFPLPLDKLNPISSQVVLDRDGQLLRAFLAPDEMWRIRVTALEVSAYLETAALTYEDRFFNWHPGFNPVSILRAAMANLRAGRVVQGGSTITMQVARLLEPKPRTFTNKLVELFRALQLELQFSKDEILTLYFNLASYGGNLVGVGAASYFYFNKPANRLSWGEAALLAALPNSPNTLRPDADQPAARAARDKILRLLAARNRISENGLQEALLEPVPARRCDLPFEAPHLADQLRRTHPQAEKLVTTIDLPTQQMVQSLVHDLMQPWLARGITNAAVVVIDNSDMAIKALVGSRDFFDARNDGQVNGALAPRSPGSALKPFVYALGIQQGVIGTQTLLNDVPVDYSGYRPVNYDEKYHGAVTAEEALIHSLNVPAVNLYAQLRNRGIYSFLKKAGITTLPHDKNYYGLSLVLGGAEVTLLELTGLYAGLANGGRFRPPRFLRDQPKGEGQALLGEGTTFIMSEMLSKVRRPDFPSVWEWSINLPKIAWKTGTSYGHRDAWSIGYNPQYTIGVWTGNFDGKGTPELVGAEVAAPILFTLFSALLQASENRWFVPPASVARRQVCTISGMPVSTYCVSRKDELYLPGVSPHYPCTIHQLILVDRASGTRLCAHCRARRTYDERVVEHWPAQIATWMERNGYPIPKIPEHFAACREIVAGLGPVIHSPSSNTEYRLRPEVDLNYQKILLDASVSNQTKTIYWFRDGKLIYSGNPTEQVFLKPTRGKHTLLCMDDEGRSSQVEIVIN